MPSRARLSAATSVIGASLVSQTIKLYLGVCSALAAQAEPEALTYAAAGVSVDAGNELVERIKPYVRATRRPGADAEIGGFGGVFDLKPLGYSDPVLVSGTDGVGTKLHVAIESGIHDTVGVYLVSECINLLLI